jgi:hypothetical protein
VRFLASTWKVDIFDGMHKINILQGVSHPAMNLDRLYLLMWVATMMDEMPGVLHPKIPLYHLYLYMDESQ